MGDPEQVVCQWLWQRVLLQVLEISSVSGLPHKTYVEIQFGCPTPRQADAVLAGELQVQLVLHPLEFTAAQFVELEKWGDVGLRPQVPPPIGHQPGFSLSGVSSLYSREGYLPAVDALESVGAE